MAARRKADLERLAALADELGYLEAKQADLEAQIAAVKKELADSGLKEIQGSLFRTVRSEYDRKVTAWKSVAIAMEAPDELIAEHTKTTHVITVQCKAR